MSKVVETFNIKKSVKLKSDVIQCDVPVIKVNVIPDTENPWIQDCNGKVVEGIKLEFDGVGMDGDDAMAMQCAMIEYNLTPRDGAPWKWFGEGITSFKNTMDFPFKLSRNIDNNDPTKLMVSIDFSSAIRLAESIILDFRFVAQRVDVKAANLAVYYSQDPIVIVRKPPIEVPD